MESQYVLITAAKNEESFIGKSIELTVAQSKLPLAWIIVDDGSDDRTGEIVLEYSKKYPFIRLFSSDSRGGRNFGSQYKAVQAGYELASALEFDYIGVQDADLAPAQQNYYADLLMEFARSPALGVASGFVYELQSGEWKSRHGNSTDSTAGSCVFRRQCFDDIGGYTPLDYGGSDTLAVIDAKILGWTILVRPDLKVFHYRPTSSEGGIWRGRFREGLMDASLGYDPLYQFLKCCRRYRNRPLILGSIVRWSGYLWWNMCLRKPLLPSQKVDFIRKEQHQRISSYFRKVSTR